MSNQQTENVQNRSHQRTTVNKNWLHYYTWLETEVINENTFLFCKLCKNRNGSTTFALGTTDLSLKGIKQHLITNEHKESELQLFDLNNSELNREDQMDTITLDTYNVSIQYRELLDKEKLSIISLMRNVYFSSKQNLSLNIYPDLCNLMSLQIENNNELIISENVSTLKPASLEKPAPLGSKYADYKNPMAGFDFLDSIANVIKQSLFQELNSSPYWSLMIDEANSIDHDKYLAIVGKFTINNMPIMRYLGMINLDSTVGEKIYDHIISFCNLNEISCDKIIHFGSDGASNMTGYKSGVSARFKKMNPFMSSNHCVSHRLHLAGKDASNEVLYFPKYEKILQEIYGYFSKSHKRQSILKLMQVIN